MNAKADKTAAPAWSVRCWCDREAIYTEIPGAGANPPYVQKWALTEGGLSKALLLMRELYSKFQPLGGNYQIPLGLLEGKSSPSISNFDKATRDAVRDVLRKQGIL